jgi:hypothetical protein
MNKIIKLIAVVFWGFFGWCIGVAVSCGLLEALNSTGGVILSSEILGAKLIPYVFCISGLIISYRLFFEE